MTRLFPLAANVHTKSCALLGAPSKGRVGACSDLCSHCPSCVCSEFFWSVIKHPGDPRGSAAGLLVELCRLCPLQGPLSMEGSPEFPLTWVGSGSDTLWKAAKPWVHSVSPIFISLTLEENFPSASVESLLINSSTNKSRSWSASVKLFIVSSAGLSKIPSIFDL